MARKRSAFGTLLTLGGLAAAGAAIYKNRDAIRGFVDELTGGAAAGDDIAVEFVNVDEPAAAEAETDIVIDRSGDAEAQDAEAD